jgi:hypothetical protein
VDGIGWERLATPAATFHQEFEPFFGRKEAQSCGEHYLRSSFAQETNRRSAENFARAVDSATARSLRQSLTELPCQAT